MTVGSWVWITQGPYRTQYGKIVRLTFQYAQVELPANETITFPVNWLRLAAQ